MIQIKRAYDPVSDQDGKRILVDRLWPRGVKKERAHLDRWAKELSPSKELCVWFSHDPAKWAEFQHRYKAELLECEEELREIAKEAKNHPLTLIYAARDQEHNEAIVLLDVIKKLMAG